MIKFIIITILGDCLIYIVTMGLFCHATDERKMINWHRLFGLALTDFFTDSTWVVELEKDLSLKRQLLDVVILRKATGHLWRD